VAPTDDSGLNVLGITDDEFKAVQQLVYRRLGINLGPEKRSLVAGRLQSVVRLRRVKSIKDYLALVESDKTGQVLSELTNQITTNHTFFFREADHFEYFSKTVLPHFVEKVQRDKSMDLRFWCAASSSGEEPYTLQMLVMEHLKAEYPKFAAGWLATDVSAKALEAARAGLFADERMADLPEQFKKQWFRKLPTGMWAISDTIKKEVTFRRLNLMNESYPFPKPFHVIFLRNVMIYFDEPTRRAVVNRMFNVLVPGGYLFIGHSESLANQGQPFQYVMPAVYRKPQ
jgi:chemotaxis protein methyltransferase CheR